VFPAIVGQSSKRSVTPSKSLSGQPLAELVPATSIQTSMALAIPSLSLSGQPFVSISPATVGHSS